MTALDAFYGIALIAVSVVHFSAMLGGVVLWLTDYISDPD